MAQRRRSAAGARPVLEIRLAKYAETLSLPTRRDVCLERDQRIRTGGFHKPGSMNRHKQA